MPASSPGETSSSSTSSSSAAKVSWRRLTRAYSALTLAAASGSSQKPGSPIRASSAAERSLSATGSKVVREQGHLLADGGEALLDHRAAATLVGVGLGVAVGARLVVGGAARVLQRRGAAAGLLGQRAV